MLQTVLLSRVTSATDALLAVAVALGARFVPDWTDAEEELVADLPGPLPLFLQATRDAIRRGEDPLGDSFCRIFSAEERRPKGATYTPQPIIDAMLAWAGRESRPARVVDPGAGSARFLVAAGRRFPDAELIAVEADPVAAILARGHLAAAGLISRSKVLLQDYREIDLPPVTGTTLFLGNPPYVRHHLIESRWKAWLAHTARTYGIEASQLAGLHAHFFLATAEHARQGDVGVLITAAEWLDVNYGRLVRDLLTGILGAKSIHVIEPSADPFPGTQTTAVITGFEIGAKTDTVGMRRVASLDELGALESDWRVGRDRLMSADRWTPLTRPSAERREGFVELGELCRVHRGQVTGANRVWIINENEYGLPDEVLFRSVTRARELFAAKDVLTDPLCLRQVIDLPPDLGVFDTSERRRIEKFLRFAKAQGADNGFIARHRKAWWSVGLRKPAPILATYMARRPPVFVRNQADARHINIAHGLYPREQLTERQLRALASHLSQCVRLEEGRTYAGGLTKFEPREMERLLVPRPELLADQAFLDSLS
ncbi:MAG: class I SAM-dependent methyltransferase [Thermomicrobiales bacterium]